MAVVITPRSKRTKLRAYEVTRGVFLIGAGDVQLGHRRAVPELLAVDGAGVLAGTFVDRWSVASTAAMQFPLNPDFVGGNLKGAAALYVEDPTRRRLQVFPDPLGAAIVYAYEGPKYLAVSADLTMLVDVLALLGVRLTKSLDFAIELAACGNGGVFPSPYRELRALKPFEYVTVRTGRIEVGRYSSEKTFFEPAGLYDTQLVKAQNEILNNLNAASTGLRDVLTSQLTGGFDSRLVLAGLISLNREKATRFYSQGDPVLPDRRIAERLSVELGLTMTEHPGTVVVEAPSDFGGKLVWPLFNSRGILGIGPHKGARVLSSARIVSGGYGGTFRSTYDFRISNQQGSDRRASSVASALWSDYCFSNEQKGLFAKDFRNRFFRGMERIFEHGLGRGLREDALGDFLYISTRARYFIAHISKSWSRFTPRFDPLYSVNATGLALSLPLEKRASNIIGFDLMGTYASPLRELPFDVPKFSPSLSRWRVLPETREWTFPESVGPRFDGKRGVEPMMIDTGILNIPPASKEDIRRAKKMRVRAYQVAGRRVVQRALPELVLGLDRSARKGVFNAKALDELLKGTLNNRIRVRMLFNLFESLAWYNA